MQRGEIWLVDFPFSSREVQPYKRRPVLVLANTGSPPDQAILVAMVTGNSQRLVGLSPGDVPVTNWHASGLAKPSTVRTRRLWTAERRDFPRPAKLGDVEQSVLNAVLAHVRHLVA